MVVKIMAEKTVGEVLSFSSPGLFPCPWIWSWRKSEGEPLRKKKNYFDRIGTKAVELCGYQFCMWNPQRVDTGNIAGQQRRLRTK